MCGSGTFVIEAAEIACRLNPGRARSFAFERSPPSTRGLAAHARGEEPPRPPARFFGSDRDAGAVAMSRANAERADVRGLHRIPAGRGQRDRTPPGPPGLVIANPPYGARIGEKADLAPLYRAFGQVLRQRFPAGASA